MVPPRQDGAEADAETFAFGFGFPDVAVQAAAGTTAHTRASAAHA
ncbi:MULTISPECIES: hypothetical protein [Streptomyces]|nr:hypothetical protein [Streptomyces sp. NEAU-HV9]